MLLFHLPPKATSPALTVFSYHGKSESSEGPLMLNHWKGRGKKQNMQTSYSKWWLLYFTLLKIGKGKKSQLTFTTFLKRAGEHQVADLITTSGHLPGSHWTLCLRPLSINCSILDIYRLYFRITWVLDSLLLPHKLYNLLLLAYHMHMEANWPLKRERIVAGPLIHYRTQCYKMDRFQTF